jgi:hypothetical protein
LQSPLFQERDLFRDPIPVSLLTGEKPGTAYFSRIIAEAQTRGFSLQLRRELRPGAFPAGLSAAAPPLCSKQYRLTFLFQCFLPVFNFLVSLAKKLSGVNNFFTGPAGPQPAAPPAEGVLIISRMLFCSFLFQSFILVIKLDQISRSDDFITFQE